MEYISSDTNVWLDFNEIDYLHIPFLLPITYLMYEEAVEYEFLDPPGLGDTLIKFGLRKVDLTEEEFYFAEEYGLKYKKLSTYDCIALAIAKARGITLLTGDNHLRKAASTEGVAIIGTIGILDCLFTGNYIDEKEFHLCIRALSDHNGARIRLPEEELQKRLHFNREEVAYERNKLKK